MDSLIRTYGVTVGRMLLGLLFLFSGVGILLNGVDGTAGMIAAKGIPLAGLVVWLVVAVKILAGGALMVGYRTTWAAAALITFTILATLLYHMDINDISLFKNLSIIGGLLYAYVYGPGDGWKI